MKRFSAVTIGLLAVLVVLSTATAYADVGNTFAGTVIKNKVTVTYTDAGSNNYSTADSVSVTVAQIYGVSVTPDSGGTKYSVTGDTVYFAITVYNTGNGTDNFNLTNAGQDANKTIKYFVDTNSNGVWDTGETEITNTGNLTPTADGNGIITTNGSINIVAMVIVTNDNTNTSNNTDDEFTVTATSAGNATKTDTQVDKVNIRYPFLTFSKTSSVDTSSQGGSYTYSITINNTGSATAKDIVITDNIPTDLTVDNVATGGVGTWSAPTWSVDSLQAGSNATLTITVTVKTTVANDALVSNTASITYKKDPPGPTDPLPGPPPGDKTKDVRIKGWTVTIYDSNNTNLRSTYAIDSTVVNVNVVYKIVATNGRNAADSLQFTALTAVFADTLWLDDGDNGFDAGDTKITIGDWLTYAKETSKTYWAVVKPAPSTADRATDQAIYESQTGLSIAFKDTSFTRAKKPILSVTKLASNATPAPGDTVQYEITYTNTGSAEAMTVVLTDVLPAQVTYKASSTEVQTPGSGSYAAVADGTVWSGSTLSYTVPAAVQGRWVSANYQGKIKFTVTVK